MSALLAALTGAAAVLSVAIWGLTGHAYFWPEWVVLPSIVLLAVQTWLALVVSKPAHWPLTRPLLAQLGISTSLWFGLVAVWALTTREYFWPAWVLLAFLVAAGLHFLAVVLIPRLQHPWAERVHVLTTTRAGAVEEQEAQLRRIERDLHDGAQARLVALGMSLALAEQRLRDDPDAAQRLVSEARSGARAALEELRDLARGIHPPLLTDRGLVPALEVLVSTAPSRVDLHCALDRRLRPTVESAAYFVTAEALTNAAKHADATQIRVDVEHDDDRLCVEITDDGRGGADPTGSGLTGLRRRVEALDGSLMITSPTGGPTVLRAEIPCES